MNEFSFTNDEMDLWLRNDAMGEEEGMMKWLNEEDEMMKEGMSLGFRKDENGKKKKLMKTHLRK